MPLVSFKLLPWCWSSEAVSLSRWVCVGSLRGTAWGSRSFFPQLNPHYFLQPEVVGTYLPGTGPWAGGPCVGLGLLTPEISLRIFIHNTWCVASPLCICAPPTSLDGCGFFHSIVVRLPFNLISDSCKWWLFHYFSGNFDVVVWRGEPCLPTPSSWLEISSVFSFNYQALGKKIWCFILVCWDACKTAERCQVGSWIYNCGGLEHGVVT